MVHLFYKFLKRKSQIIQILNNMVWDDRLQRSNKTNIKRHRAYVINLYVTTDSLLDCVHF